MRQESSCVYKPKVNAPRDRKQTINQYTSFSHITLFLVLLVFLVHSCFSYPLLLRRENHMCYPYETRFYKVPHKLSSFYVNIFW
jgi:hypothetical protein